MNFSCHFEFGLLILSKLSAFYSSKTVSTALYLNFNEQSSKIIETLSFISLTFFVSVFFIKIYCAAWNKNVRM